MQTQGQNQATKASFNWYIYYLSKRAYLLYTKSIEMEPVGEWKEEERERVASFHAEITHMLTFSEHLSVGDETQEDVEMITRIHLYLLVQMTDEEKEKFDERMDMLSRIFWGFFDELIRERMQTSQTKEEKAKHKLSFVSLLRTIETAKSRQEAMKILGMTTQKKRKPTIQQLKQDVPYIVVALALVILLDLFLSNVGGWELLMSWFNT